MLNLEKALAASLEKQRARTFQKDAVIVAY